MWFKLFGPFVSFSASRFYLLIELLLDWFRLFQETQEADIEDWDWLFNKPGCFEATDFLRTTMLLLPPPSYLLNKMLDFIEFWVESLALWNIEPLIIFGFNIGVKLATFSSFWSYCFIIYGCCRDFLLHVELDFWINDDEFLKACFEVFWVESDSSDAFKVIVFAWS